MPSNISLIQALNSSLITSTAAQAEITQTATAIPTCTASSIAPATPRNSARKSWPPSCTDLVHLKLAVNQQQQLEAKQKLITLQQELQALEEQLATLEANDAQILP